MPINVNTNNNSPATTAISLRNTPLEYILRMYPTSIVAITVKGIYPNKKALPAVIFPFQYRNE